MNLPNIVLMHCHDVGRFLGSYGYPTVNTPHLDALARDGVQLDNAFASAPQCSPSRASLFTGRWPHANGVMGLTQGWFGWDLHPGERHLAARLRDVGYRSVLLGVHHESRKQPDDDVARQLGFDLVDTSEILAAPVADLAVSHLGQLSTAGQPFYLQVGFAEPHRLPGDRDPDGTMGFVGNHIQPDDSAGVHIPAYLRQDEAAREELAELQGAVRHMDEAAGAVLQEIQSLGIADDTLVIFTTDHGLALPRAKCSLYDPGLEVAMILRCPGRGWIGGGRHDDLVTNLDVVPTVLDLLGIDVDDDIQGRSFLALLDGDDHTAREEIFGEITHHDHYDPRRCIRTRRHKLIANFSSAHVFMDPSQSWNRRCTPVIEPIDFHPPVELYDLEHDPHELTNVAGDHPDLVAELSQRLYAWMDETDDPLLHGAVTPPLHHHTIDALTSSRQGDET